jgi:hypothetical protein
MALTEQFLIFTYNILNNLLILHNPLLTEGRPNVFGYKLYYSYKSNKV